MFIYCNLVVLMLVLTSMSHVHAGRIIGGHEAAAHSRPYMALLERTMDDNNKSYCGGFILNEDFVMTAAHCEAKSYKVFVGFHNFHEINLKSYSVEQDFPHEDFNANKAINDIMLLKLSEKIKFNEHVKAIDLADQCNDGMPKSCSVSGWGQTTNKNKYMSSELMELKVTLINDDMCAAEKWYCSEGEKGPGLGDSGGPLVCEDGKAYGVVSASWPKETEFKTFVYTKIPDYREWINGIIKNEQNF